MSFRNGLLGFRHAAFPVGGEESNWICPGSWERRGFVIQAQGLGNQEQYSSKRDGGWWHCGRKLMDLHW